MRQFLRGNGQGQVTLGARLGEIISPIFAPVRQESLWRLVATFAAPALAILVALGVSPTAPIVILAILAAGLGALFVTFAGLTSILARLGTALVRGTSTLTGLGISSLSITRAILIFARVRTHAGAAGGGAGVEFMLVVGREFVAVRRHAASCFLGLLVLEEFQKVVGCLPEEFPTKVSTVLGGHRDHGGVNVALNSAELLLQTGALVDRRVGQVPPGLGVRQDFIMEIRILLTRGVRSFLNSGACANRAVEHQQRNPITGQLMNDNVLNSPVLQDVQHCLGNVHGCLFG